MTRDPQSEQEASGPTEAEALLSGSERCELLSRAACWAIEFRFKDGSRLVYEEGKWTAAPAVMTPEAFMLKCLRQAISEAPEISDKEADAFCQRLLRDPPLDLDIFHRALQLACEADAKEKKC